MENCIVCSAARTVCHCESSFRKYHVFHFQALKTIRPDSRAAPTGESIWEHARSQSDVQRRADRKSPAIVIKLVINFLAMGKIRPNNSFIID